jgi:hypothetical protein
MKSWFRVVRPHDDIRSNNLAEAVFAANLAQVERNEGPEVYRDPEKFFAKTYFTQGMRNLARQVIRGLNQDARAGNRIISLQTGFGGGKTHSLISLYHLATLGRSANERADLQDLIAHTGKLEFDVTNPAVFTNRTNDPVQGRKTHGLHIRTLWGELAFQLGGKEGYELIRANDEAMTAPKGVFGKVLEAYPGLILLDELADYCVSATGVPVGGNTLGDQTISFVQELTEAVDAVPGCVLVATLPASEKEVAASEKGASILSSLAARLARTGKDTKPVDGAEIYEVIRRRLFEDIGPEEVRKQVASDYIAYYKKDLRNEVPDDIKKASYRKLIEQSYPFHPGLIHVFEHRWASNHDFQRTRGVLQLLGSIVGDLWKRRDALGGSGLIHTSHVNFSNVDALSTKLTSLYGNGYAAVLSADVSGPNSNAHKIDEEIPEHGEFDLAKGVASTIMLASFGADGANKGLSVGEIKQYVLPCGSANHNQVNTVLNALEGKAHYLHYSTAGGREKRYWFHTKANVNILINEAKGQVSDGGMATEVVRRLEQAARSVRDINFIIDPSADIPEQKRFSVVVLSPRYRSSLDQLTTRAKDKIIDIAARKGNADRQYKNTMLYLLCSEIGYTKLKERVQDYLATKKIRDTQTMLDDDQRKLIGRRLAEVDAEVNSVLVAGYSIVAKVQRGEISMETLPTHAASMELQLQDKLPGFLKDQQWLLDRIGYRLLDRNKLTPQPGKPISAQQVYEAFLRFDNFPMITGPEAVQNSLLRYFEKGEFGLADGGTPPDFNNYYHTGEPVDFFSVTDEDTYLVANEDLPAPTLHDPKTASTNSFIGARTSGVAGYEKDPVAVLGATTPQLPDKQQLRQVSVKGEVALARYNELFRYFIQPLADQNVRIQVTITGSSTEDRPIYDSDQKVKNMREAARQLGLDMTEE